MPIQRINMRCIVISAEFKNFKDHFQNSRTFQGYSKIFTKIQGLFKDFKDQLEIQGFQGIFQGCGNPANLELSIHIHLGPAWRIQGSCQAKTHFNQFTH